MLPLTIFFTITVSASCCYCSLSFLCVLIAPKEASYHCTYILYHLPILIYPVFFTTTNVSTFSPAAESVFRTATMPCAFFAFVWLLKKPVTAVSIFPDPSSSSLWKKLNLFRVVPVPDWFVLWENTQ